MGCKKNSLLMGGKGRCVCGEGGGAFQVSQDVFFPPLSVSLLLALSLSPGRRGLVCGCRMTIEKKEKKCLKKNK